MTVLPDLPDILTEAEKAVDTAGDQECSGVGIDGLEEDSEQRILTDLMVAFELRLRSYSKAIGVDADALRARLREKSTILNSPERLGHRLTLEVQNELLAALEVRFNENRHRHEGVRWKDVWLALKADPEKLWSLQQLELAGHEPDVYSETENVYRFGTCSLDSPESGTCTVYDAEAEAYFNDFTPQRNVSCNGNVVGIARAMGVSLMSEHQYLKLISTALLASSCMPRFDQDCGCRLKTPAAIRSQEDSICSGLRGVKIIDVETVWFSLRNLSFRASLDVWKVRTVEGKNS
jgi:hypothetical protein